MSNTRLDKLRELLENQPDDSFMQYAVGFEYESSGDFGQALEWYEKILAQHKEYLPVYYQCGLLYAQLGRFEKAVALLREGIILAKAQGEDKMQRELMAALEQVEDDME
jgi:tetratricopeptide (TPR) repeat protein